MKKTTAFHTDRDRYHYDFGPCSAPHGFAQLDTTQDASYYGAWANPHTLTVVEYCEGDETVIAFGNDREAFAEWVRDFAQSDRFKGIDTFNDVIGKAFADLGLADLTHEEIRPPALVRERENPHGAQGLYHVVFCGRTIAEADTKEECFAFSDVARRVVNEMAKRHRARMYG